MMWVISYARLTIVGQHVPTRLTRKMEDTYVLAPSSYGRVLRFFLASECNDWR
jgi:hypothetical protein